MPEWVEYVTYGVTVASAVAAATNNIPVPPKLRWFQMLMNVFAMNTKPKG